MRLVRRAGLRLRASLCFIDRLISIPLMWLHLVVELIAVATVNSVDILDEKEVRWLLITVASRRGFNG